MDELEEQSGAGAAASGVEAAAELAGAAPAVPPGDQSQRAGHIAPRPEQQQQQQRQMQEPHDQQQGRRSAPQAAAAGEEPFQQQPAATQQLVVPTPGARNYGYADDFMMFCFKVEPCSRTDKHPRGSCPYAHPGDVARRRHPSRYQALLCPEVRAKKVCPRMDECQCSHSAFEFWLHPDRYRTSMCEKGVRCSRPVCFFAHTSDELRPLPAGLKPAMQEEAGGPGGPGGSGSSRRASSSGGGLRAAVQPFMLQAPPGGMPAGAGGLLYLQHQQQLQQQQQQQHMLIQPGMALPPPPGGPGYPPMRFVPLMQGAEQYGHQPGLRYSPAADAPHAAGGAPVVVPGGAGPYAHHGGSPALPHAPAQLPGDVVQSFARLAVGPSSAGAAAGGGGGYEHGAPAAGGEQWGPGQPPQVVMLVQPGASTPQLQQPYAPQLLYMPGPMEPSGPWPQQQQHGQGSGSGGFGPPGGVYGQYGPPAPHVAPSPVHAGSGPASADDGRGAPGLAMLAPGPPAPLSIGSAATPTAAGGAIGVLPMLQPGSRPL